ncbi:MAG: futalosine hydrolase [Deltaproteobacteria bacterium]|nr:MAG: futalosine hydrolase [Deltaproteobacteria bacterium]
MSARPLLLAVYAHPREGAEVRPPPSVRLVEVGVGKVAAALGTFEAVHDARPAAVLSFGLCGTYDGRALGVGAACRVRQAVLSDEGVCTPHGFLGLGDLGLGTAEPLDADGGLDRWLDHTAGPLPAVRAATVSTCAGASDLARARRERSGAVVETMESYAIAAACARLGVPWAEVRVVSNETGDRDRARFDLDGAAAAGRALVERIFARWEEAPPWNP